MFSWCSSYRSNIIIVVERGAEGSYVGEAPLCTTCEMAVVWMQSQLKQQVTKERVIEPVDQLCEKLPSPMGESVFDCNSISSVPNITFTVKDKAFVLSPEQDAVLDCF